MPIFHRLASIIPVFSFALTATFMNLSGCGKTPSGPTFVRATGQVSYQGKPLESGQVSFIPDHSKGTSGPMASGRINENGEFSLQSQRPGDGAIVGFHKVIISRYKEVPFDPNNPSPPLASISLIPTKYADEQTSNLTAEVTENPSKNRYIFELKQ